MTDAQPGDRPHKHRCLRCKEEFSCRTPEECTAKYDVLPNIIIRGADGEPRVVEHCRYQPTPEFRERPCYSCETGTRRVVEFLVCDSCGDFGVKAGDSPQNRLIAKIRGESR